MENFFSRAARWIWLSDVDRPNNAYACFRRRFAMRGGNRAAKVRITADSRYELYINGQWVGHGPPRSWPTPWPVDEYDVGHLLRDGDNVLAVLVHHFGISTFQYLHDAPGLLAELEVGEQRIVTDATWRCIAHRGYAWPVPRISCQQGWEEQFDARVAPGAASEWSAPGFDDSTWQGAREVRRAGEGSHSAFELLAIPALTRSAVEPVAVRQIEAVRAAPYSFTLNPRDLLNPLDKSANVIRGRMLLVTFIESATAQEIQLHPPHDRPQTQWKLNGKMLSFDDRSLQRTGTGVAHAKLKAGVNTLMCKLAECEHFWWAAINLWTKSPVAFSSKREDETPWLALGPFAGARQHPFDRITVEPLAIDGRATAERFDEIWNRGCVSDQDLAESFCRPLTRDMVVTTDIYAKCASERIVENLGGDWSEIQPRQDADVRLLFDFGKETIGYHEFEIDAPAGAVLDFHNFEFIQRDGRINLTEGMNNSFRYVCREGAQRYRTFVRRGFRYSWMTLRNFSRPVRIRFVRVIQSTYPIGPAGSFECSDPMLNRIWEAGVHSVRCCAEDTYTDCPTYEQTFWVGDARNEALVHLVADGDPRLSGHCLTLAGRSLDRSPIVESQVPSGWQNLLPTWSFLWMRWAQEHYLLTGDQQHAREMLVFIERNVAGIRDNLNDLGLFRMFAWNLFDWAPMDTPAGGIVTHINCLAVQGLKQSAQLATQLGRGALARKWDRLAGGISEAVNRHLWSDRKRAYIDCIRADGSPSPVFSQQTQTAAYISGVAGGVRAKRCLAIIDRPPRNFVRAGSPFFMFFLLEALVREKRYDALVKTIRDYWGRQIDAGATTFWEMYHPEAERLTRSHCHGWSAAPVVFLTQYVLGVRPLTPGYGETLIAPHIGNLAWAQGRVPTSHGPIDCYWRNLRDAFELTLNVPPRIRTRIELPVTGKLTIKQGRVRRAPSRGGITLTSRSGKVSLRVVM